MSIVPLTSVGGCLQHMRLYALILQLLERGSGLSLGPDSDGLLNFCDPLESQTLEQRILEPGEQKAEDKGIQRAAELLDEELSEVPCSTFAAAVLILDACLQRKQASGRGVRATLVPCRWRRFQSKSGKQTSRSC